MDFFTPVVDDPYDFGRIAAANALSDIWAMGAKPLFALNLVGWPVGKLPNEMLGEVLRGGLFAAGEAGIPVLGGHSIDDPEPKYGMAVTGVVHPERILRNVGAKEGDLILLTKPLGSGIVTTAIKRGLASTELVRSTVEVMSALNRAAGEAFAGSDAVHALTDVTGFGLLGHAWEMAEGSGVTIRFRTAEIPLIAGVKELAAKDIFPGGSRANLEWVRPHLMIGPKVDPILAAILADAQTNGGLLAAIPKDRVAAVLRDLERANVSATVVGEVFRGDPPRIELE